MAPKTSFVAVVGIILGGLPAAAPAQATPPTVDARDRPNDVKILPFTSPLTTITKAERLSIDIRRLTVTPRTDGTIRFKVKIGEILKTTRFFQQIDVTFKPVSTSTAGWIGADVNWSTGPFGSYAYMELPTYFQRRCRPRHVRSDPDTDTFSANVPNRCVPVGDAKVIVQALTRYRTGGDTSSTDDFSRDKLKVPLAAVH
jgi:hypothetical protein